MRQQLQDALGRSRAGYTELRLQQSWSTSVLVRGRLLETAGTAVDCAGMARCCSPGTGWGLIGFSGSDRLDGPVLRAHELSLAGASRVPVALAPIPIRQLDAVSPLADDPREVSLPEKRRAAQALGEALAGVDRRITGMRVLCRDLVVERWLATSEGTWIHDLRSELAASVLAEAEEDGTAERALGSIRLSGWREAAALESLAVAVAGRALERLHASPIRPGRYPVVLDRAAAGALMHRAVSHIARPSLPGADPDVLPLGTRLGPDCLTVGDDPTARGLGGSAIYDDEGTEARHTTLIQHGVVVGHLHSRETAAAARQAATGHARAGSLRGAPYPRTGNAFVAQGQGSLDDLLAGITRGVYLVDALSCEATGESLGLRAGAARMIRHGRLAEPVKGVELAGGLLALLGQVEAVGADFAWDPAGARCRDGAAGVVPITTGAPHLRLAEVPVGAVIS